MIGNCKSPNQKGVLIWHLEISPFRLVFRLHLSIKMEKWTKNNVESVLENVIGKCNKTDMMMMMDKLISSTASLCAYKVVRWATT